MALHRWGTIFHHNVQREKSFLGIRVEVVPVLFSLDILLCANIPSFSDGANPPMENMPHLTLDHFGVYLPRRDVVIFREGHV